MPVGMRWLGLLTLASTLIGVACGADHHQGSNDDKSPPTTPSATPPSDSPPVVVGGGEEPLIGTFPRGFAFGTAIAGFQVDMGCPTLASENCEDRASDWYQWITTKRIVDNPILFMSKAWR